MTPTANSRRSARVLILGATGSLGRHVGGAAFLVAKAIHAARVLAFPELGMEAVREFEVQDMPVTVAVDSGGYAIHETGPREWRARIAKMPMVET